MKVDAFCASAWSISCIHDNGNFKVEHLRILWKCISSHCVVGGSGIQQGFEMEFTFNVVDLACNREGSWFQIQFVLLFRFNVGHEKSLEIIDAAVVIDGAVNSEEVIGGSQLFIAWLAVVIIRQLSWINVARLLVVEVIVMVFFS